MRHRMKLVAAVIGVALAGIAPSGAQAPAKPAPKPSAPAPVAGPVVTVDTIKGTIVFETYPQEAPKSVEHIVKTHQKAVL